MPIFCTIAHILQMKTKWHKIMNRERERAKKKTRRILMEFCTAALVFERFCMSVKRLRQLKVAKKKKVFIIYTHSTRHTLSNHANNSKKSTEFNRIQHSLNDFDFNFILASRFCWGSLIYIASLRLSFIAFGSPFEHRFLNFPIFLSHSKICGTIQCWSW